jgi:hypothetical protein
MGKEFEIERVVDSLATISSILFNRLHWGCCWIFVTINNR